MNSFDYFNEHNTFYFYGDLGWISNWFLYFVPWISFLFLIIIAFSSLLLKNERKNKQETIYEKNKWQSKYESPVQLLLKADNPDSVKGWNEQLPIQWKQFPSKSEAVSELFSVRIIHNFWLKWCGRCTCTPPWKHQKLLNQCTTMVMYTPLDQQRGPWPMKCLS